jgi:hypothetical protein
MLRYLETLYLGLLTSNFRTLVLHFHFKLLGNCVYVYFSLTNQTTIAEHHIIGLLNRVRIQFNASVLTYSLAAEFAHFLLLGLEITATNKTLREGC